jgi:simple sugar transport system ATP-binding protein
MVGREVVFSVSSDSYPVPDEELAAARPVLTIRDLEATNDKGLPALQGISIMVNKYEVLGIAGVAGNGQRELAEIVTGLRKASAGRIVLGEHDVTNQSPRRAINLGMSHVPEDRMRTGLIANMSVSDNLILKDYRRPPLARFGFLISNAIRRFAERLIQEFEIATPNPDVHIKGLSGGNLQKAILAREISASGDVIVAVHPTRGLDVGATEWVQHTLLQQRQRGAGILLISGNLDELLALSDRIAVMYEGRVMGILPGREADVEEIGLMMAGSEVDSVQEVERT